MFNLALRNMRIYFRDRTGVFFSLLSVLIILLLYLVFLGDVMFSAFSDLPGVRQMMDAWLMAGIMAVTTLTTAMGALGIMVEDRQSRRIKDFYAAPLKRYQVAGGYLFNALSVGIIMTLIAFILSQVYTVAGGGTWLSPLGTLKFLGVLFLAVLSSGAMAFFLVTLLKGNNAYGAASTIMGTLVGFLAGIYIPIGTLPQAVQAIVRFFPTSHAAVLFRQVMMESAMAETFAGAPQAMIDEICSELGVTLTYGGTVATPLTHILVLVGTALLFFALAVIMLSRKERNPAGK